MPEQEYGLYYSGKEESFKNIREIREDDIQKVSVEFAKPHNKSVAEWFEEIERRNQFRNEIEDIADYGKIEIKTNRPAVIGLPSDWHLGAKIDKPMLQRDIEIMATHPLVSGCFFLELLESLLYIEI